MLELRQIESFYPEHLRPFKRNILREYLQYKILASIFGGKYASMLVFMGGTAIHIVHGVERFSEDLDFDNKGMTQDDFRSMAEEVKRNLILEGFSVEIGVSFNAAFTADIKITNLLFDSGLSGHKEEKVLIKIDTQSQDFDYKPERVVINKFDVFCGIAVVPATILLAQKYYAILNRKRAMGRDFFDVAFLAGLVKPDFRYLKEKTGIVDKEGLKSALSARCGQLNFKQLTKDVEPFVFAPLNAAKIETFPDWVKGM